MCQGELGRWTVTSGDHVPLENAGLSAITSRQGTPACVDRADVGAGRRSFRGTSSDKVVAVVVAVVDVFGCALKFTVVHRAGQTAY